MKKNQIMIKHCIRHTAIVLFFLSVYYTFGQKKQPPTTNNKVVIASYNVEDLFDTINQPKVFDDYYTPDGKYEWNTEKYNAKITNLSKPILKMAENNGPDFIALIEVENKNVLEDLCTKTYIGKSNYGIEHYDSPDKRGLDVALLYKQRKFKVLESKAIPVAINGERVRDILYVKGIFVTNDTLHFFVNHWSSRYEGAKASESKRIEEAKKLKYCIDTLQQANPNSNIIILGDFNDNPEDASISKILKAGVITKDSVPDFINPFASIYKKNKAGSVVYQDKWYMYDQIIVSKSFLNKEKGLIFNPKDAYIFNPEWLSYTNKKKGKVYPNKTFMGNKYLGGFSDHYPVYILMENKRIKANDKVE